MPSASASPRSTSCADASGAAPRRSTCLLLYRPPLGETAKARLEIMRETEDGFRIAEEDLSLRGEGDLLGTRQSGMPGFRVARIETHGKLIDGGAQGRAADVARDPNSPPARRGAAPPALSVRARRGDPAAAVRGRAASPRSPRQDHVPRQRRVVPRHLLAAVAVITSVRTAHHDGRYRVPASACASAAPW